jgi:hypothetical protein
VGTVNGEDTGLTTADRASSSRNPNRLCAAAESELAPNRAKEA